MRAVLGILGGGLAGLSIQWLRTRHARSDTLELPPGDRRLPSWLYKVDIDDDTAAEIIKRSIPALQRACEL